MSLHLEFRTIPDIGHTYVTLSHSLSRVSRVTLNFTKIPILKIEAVLHYLSKHEELEVLGNVIFVTFSQHIFVLLRDDCQDFLGTDKHLFCQVCCTCCMPQ